MITGCHPSIRRRINANNDVDPVCMLHAYFLRRSIIRLYPGSVCKGSSLRVETLCLQDISSGGYRGIPRPAQRYNLSRLSSYSYWTSAICTTPPWRAVQQASKPEAWTTRRQHSSLFCSFSQAETAPHHLWPQRFLALYFVENGVK